MHRPVFIVGCPRSGTTLLYSMLVAAGGFACYRKETHFYAIAPRFPDLASPAARWVTGQVLDTTGGLAPKLKVNR